MEISQNKEDININNNENDIKEKIINEEKQEKINEDNKEDIINIKSDEKKIESEKLKYEENDKKQQDNKTNDAINEENVIETVEKDNEEKELTQQTERKKLSDEKAEEEIQNSEQKIKQVINQEIKEEEKDDKNMIKENKILEKEEVKEEKNELNIIEGNDNKKENIIKENEAKNLDNKIMEKILKYTESNYKEFIKEKNFCDYYNGKEWRSGYIISISKENAIIIDAINSNCSKKIININDRKNISYIRKYSLPDNNMTNGSTKNLKNKLQQFLAFHKYFENYMKNCSNFDFYYFLRVTVYYGLDFGMNPNIGSDNVYISFKLILSIMDIIIDCLKFIVTNIQDFISFETNIKNTELNDLVLLDKKFAIFSFFDDIHFLLKKIFADSPKYLDWYIKYKKEINKFNPALNTNIDIDSSKYNIPSYKEETLKKICVKEIYDNILHTFYTLDKEINSVIIAYLVDYFSQKDGFKFLFKLIYSIKTINEDNFKIIFALQNKLIDDLFLVKAITDAFNNSHQEEKIDLENYINNYLNKLEEKIFEKIGKDEFVCFYCKIFDLIEKNEDKKKILKEKVLINYNFNKFISEKKLDKRIALLTEINNIITSTEYNELSQKIYSSKKDNKNSELNEEMLNDKKFHDRNKEINNITSHQFCKICQEKNIIHFILSNNSHEEIIKRLYPVIKIMYINNFGCEVNEIEKILNLKESLFKALFQRLKEVEKNNEILYQILQDIIINFTECLSEKDKFQIFLMIKNYFVESIYNNGNKHSKINNIFNLIINFSLNSITNQNNEVNEEKNEDISEEKYYCLDILLQILLDKKKIDELNINLTKDQKIEIINLSIKGIIDIIKKADFNENLIKIVSKKIMATIFTLSNIIQNIILLEQLNTKHVLFKEAIDDFCSRKSDEEMINLINELYTISNSDKEKELYETEYKLEKILDFIFFLFQSQKYLKKDFEKINIFNLLFSQNEAVKKIFYEKLTKNLSLIKYEIKIFIFEKILTNPKSSFEIKTLQSYQLLKEFIINLNTLSNKFSFISKNEFMVIFEKITDIFGYENLFKILLENENEEIQNDIQGLISDIYLGVKYSSMEKYKNFWNEIVSNIINKLKDLVLKNDKNNPGIKGIIGLLKKIIEKSSDDGEIIKNKQVINILMDKVKNNIKEKDSNNNIKVIFEYGYFKEEEKENNKDKEINTIKELVKIRKEGEIYSSEFFYYLRYLLSYEFEIPLKCIQASIPTKDEDDPIILNLLDDYFPIYGPIKSIFNQTSKKNGQKINISVRKIKNPLNDEKKPNIKNIIKSNKELLSILRDLLKKRNSDNTLDILEIVKDNSDDFIKKGIFDDFNKLINEPNTNTNLLNELFNFNDASIFYKNLILSNLFNFLTKSVINEPNVISKFIESSIWNNKLKNIEIKNDKNEIVNNNEINKNEFLEEIKYISSILNIYKIISNEFNDDDKNNIELISSKLFDIFYFIINDSINKNLETDEIKKMYCEIINDLIEFFKSKENISFSFINLLLKEKEKLLDDIKFCFVDGILRNKYPFINNKINEFILSLVQNKLFNEDKENIKDIQNNFYLFLSSIFFDKTNNTNKYVSDIINELIKNINGDNENIYIYNIKSYFSMLSKILYIIYKYTSKEINYENYIIESVIPFIYEPLIKKETKYSNKINDIYFGTQSKILYNYIEVINIENITKEQYDLIFNHKGRNLKKYLFEDIIMLNCDKASYKNISKLKNSLQISLSSKEANHLFVSLLIKDINNNNDLIYYLEKIKYYNTLGYWYGDEISNWKINFNTNEKISTSSFIGLKNLGCTCYMNSLMQTFYSIIPLRESFLRFKIEQKAKNCLYEVQKLFFSLKFCKEKFYTPSSFVENYDKEKLNTHQQMDIDEFFSNLIDKLENRLKNTENENIIKYFFQGTLNDVLTFQEGCSHHRTNISNFYSIQLQIRNKKSLYESLDTLIEGELMNEDNCIFCPECNKKMPAVKSQNFKTLPRMLIFVLKRFEFDFNTMTRTKLNDYYEFPIELNMNKYTSEYLNNKENINNNLYKLKSIVIHQGHCEGGHYYAFIRDGLSQEWYQFNDTHVTEFDIKNIPKEAFGGNTNNNAYLLFYEKEDMSNCEKFEKIKEINILENNKNIDNIESDNIENEKDNLSNEKDNKDNINNDEEGFNLIKENEIINDKSIEKGKIEKNDNDNKINKEEVDDEEIKNNLNKKLFHRDYHHLTLELYLNILNMINNDKINDLLSNEENQNNRIHPIEKQLDLVYKQNHFCQNLSKYIKEGKIKIFKNEDKSKIKFTEEDIKQRNLQIFEYILLNYFNVIIHSEERKYLGCYVDLIKTLINKYEYCANYLLEEFTNYNVIMEYLKNCPLYEIKKITVGIIDYAMNSSINFYEKNKDKNINSNPNSKNLDKISENIISNNENNLDKNKKEYICDFEEFKEEEISESKKATQDEDSFEVLDVEKELKEREEKEKRERNKGPSTRHYIDMIREENEDNNKNDEIKKNSLLLENDNIPKKVLNLIYNIIYVMKKITFSNYIESRFLFAVLLKFSQISNNSQNFLKKDINILLTLNILLFQKLRQKNYDYDEVFEIGNSYLLDTTHEILNPKPGKTIRGDFDKFKNINLKYDFLLLCNLSYNIEESLDYNKDPGFSFNNPNYIVDLIKTIDTKQELNYVSNLLKKKCLNNKEIFNKILNSLKFIIDKINDSDDAFYDKFEPENNSEIYRNAKKKGTFLKRLRNNVHIIIINLFELKDDNLAEYRQKEILNELFSMFREYKRYYSITLYIINIIIDIYLRGEEFTKKRLNKINEIKDWLEKNKIAPKLYEIRGIEMYKDTPIHKSLYIDLKNISEVNQRLKDEFDKEETTKTNKKISYINNILNGLEEKSEIEMDLNRYNFDIGEKVIYGNKKFEIIEALDEMIKIKEIKETKDNMDLIFKVKGFKNKKRTNKEKEEECFWIEKDNYKLKIYKE